MTTDPPPSFDDVEKVQWDNMTPEQRTEAYLELFPPPTPEQVAEAERRRAELLAAVNDATPDIRFESFWGACPEQGFGWWIPTGEAVYFRVRNDFASLEVGNVDPKRKPGDAFYPSVAFDGVRLTASVTDIGGFGNTEGPEHAKQVIRTLRAMLRPADDATGPDPQDRTEAFIRALRQLEELYAPGQVT